MSSFKDSLCLISLNKKILLFNLVNDSTIYKKELEYSITLVKFESNSRSLLYAGDVRGNFYTIDIFLDNVVKTNMFKYSIQTISSLKDTICICTLFDGLKKHITKNIF